MENQYEIYKDPFDMLVLFVSLVAEQKGERLNYEKVPSFENDTCLLRPSLNIGDNNSDRIPNFVYKKEQVEIRWDEFLGEAIVVNKDLSREQYNRMFIDCMASLYGIAK